MGSTPTESDNAYYRWPRVYQETGNKTETVKGGSPIKAKRQQKLEIAVLFSVEMNTRTKFFLIGRSNARLLVQKMKQDKNSASASQNQYWSKLPSACVRRKNRSIRSSLPVAVIRALN